MMAIVYPRVDNGIMLIMVYLRVSPDLINDNDDDDVDDDVPVSEPVCE